MTVMVKNTKYVLGRLNQCSLLFKNLQYGSK